jgi:hypothetical protein
MISKLDMLNMRFGKLIVKNIDRIEKSVPYYLCICDCGGEIILSKKALISKKSISCGCEYKELFIDLKGRRFGKLLVVEKSERPMELKDRSAYWLCKCDCGGEKVISAHSLVRNLTNSCGCLALKPNSESGFNCLYSSYLSCAKDRNIIFELDKDIFRLIVNMDCFYCGEQPSSIKKAVGGDYIYNGIDRVDSSLGYTTNNIVPCCKFCNYAKRINSQEYFIDKITQIYNHLNNQGLIKQNILEFVI